ncbi:MAG: acyl carrier protein [Alphaproteobacteria bacterium]|nr:acyl carrier protein [Alphaproteobacteria bacterium]
MEKEQIIEGIKDLLDTEADLNEGTVLDDIEEWDSLASISVLAFFKQKMGLKIEAQALKDCKTVGDILKLAGK